MPILTGRIMASPKGKVTEYSPAKKSLPGAK
jgi:hypothetical protein